MCSKALSSIRYYLEHCRVIEGCDNVGWSKDFTLTDVTWISDSNNYIRTAERNADVLLNACKDIGLAVNTGKTKYREIGRHRGVIANAHIKIGSNSYEKVETFKYLGSLLKINTFKYHVFAPMGRFQLESIYLYFPPSSQLLYCSVL